MQLVQIYLLYFFREEAAVSWFLSRSCLNITEGDDNSPQMGLGQLIVMLSRDGHTQANCVVSARLKLREL